MDTGKAHRIKYITVGELLNRLSEYSPDMPVIFADSSYEINEPLWDEEDGEEVDIRCDYVLGSDCTIYKGNFDKVGGYEIVMPSEDVNNDNFMEYAVISIDGLCFREE